jgi:hypothetical protein
MLLVQNRSGKAVLHAQCKMQLSNSLCFHNGLWSLPVNSSHGERVLTHTPRLQQPPAPRGRWLLLVSDPKCHPPVGSACYCPRRKEKTSRYRSCSYSSAQGHHRQLKMLDPSMGKRGRGLQFGSGKWEIRPLDYGAFI